VTSKWPNVTSVTIAFGDLHNLRLAFGALDLQFVRSSVKEGFRGRINRDGEPLHDA
jgi:hypothetical protein